MAVFELELDLPRTASAAAVARHALQRSLPEGLDPERTDDLMLLISELVINAVEHGDGAIRLRLRLANRTATGEVIDQGGGFEREVREHGVDELRGRGLLIVDALSSSWGVHEGTTHVWFEMDLDDRPDATSGPALGESERPPQLPTLD